jgi:hypothetical protein
VPGVKAGHQGCPRRGANSGSAIRLREAHSLASHPVKIRRLNELLPITAHISLGEIITQDEDDVRPSRRSREIRVQAK